VLVALALLAATLGSSEPLQAAQPLRGEPVLPAPHHPVSSPSRAPVPAGNLQGWRQVFSDDFNQPVPQGKFPDDVNSAWGAYPWPWPDTSHHGRYAPHRVVEVDGGVLTEHLRTDKGETGKRRYPLVAALTPKLPGSDQHGTIGGRFAVRFRADPVPGYKIAWLLWPDSGSKRSDGEIDFPEMDLAPVGSEVPHVSGFVHRRKARGDADQIEFAAPMQVTQWHTAVIEWTPKQVVFVLDGKEIGRTNERIPSSSMHWVLQTETGLRASSAPAADAAGVVQIDWVAAWVPDPSARAAGTALESQATVKIGFEPSGAMGGRRSPNNGFFTRSPLLLAFVPPRRPARRRRGRDG
jgi:hypothetical protein